MGMGEQGGLVRVGEGPGTEPRPLFWGEGNTERKEPVFSRRGRVEGWEVRYVNPVGGPRRP